jgi:tetratricopeptide (TPR) repeat protein
MDEASKNFEEALKTFRDFAHHDPETFLPYVAETLNNLGNLHRAQNLIDEGRQALQEALGIYENLARRSPARFAGDVTRIKDLLAQPPQR